MANLLMTTISQSLFDLLLFLLLHIFNFLTRFALLQLIVSKSVNKTVIFQEQASMLYPQHLCYSISTQSHSRLIHFIAMSKHYGNCHGRGYQGSQKAPWWQGARAGLDLPLDAEGSRYCGTFVVGKSFQCHQH